MQRVPGRLSENNPLKSELLLTYITHANGQASKPIKKTITVWFSVINNDIIV